MTQGCTVRELAKSYGAGKTSWSDYRSGAKLIPLELLHRVVCSRVRDVRGRTELWGRAKSLHAAARAAEEGSSRSGGQREEAPLTWGALHRAQQLADAELAQSEDTLRTLLELTAKLQQELDQAINRAEGRPTDRAEHQAKECPREAGEAVTAHEVSDRRVPGKELALWVPRPPALRGLKETLIRVGTEAEARKRQVVLLRDEVRHLAARAPEPPVAVLDSREAVGSVHSRLPVGAIPSRTLRRSDDRRRVGGILLLFLTVAALALTVSTTSLESWRERAAPLAPGPVPALVPEAERGRPSAGSPSPGSTPPVPSASPSRPAVSDAPRSGPTGSAPQPPTSQAPPVQPIAPGSASQVPAPAGSGVYAIAQDKTVIQWSGTKWATLGGAAAELYTGPAGVFATDPVSGALRGYSGTPGRWHTVSDRASGFTVSGRELYRLAQDRSTVHRWDRAHGTWIRVGGPAGRLYGGGAGLFATDPVDGRIFAYTGEGDAWVYAGTAGADFAVTDQHLYGLTPDRKAVFRWTGQAGRWSQIGGPASALYAGGSEIYASNEADGGLWRYRAGLWSHVGEAGVAFGAHGDRLYRLDKDSSAIWERSGTIWRRIGGPARALAVAE
ncbi:hypothetical protein [Streptomyces xanthochromogenes]|uniref:hypothetical protein n=1 Tax=Streptomyces xanthochromogenes TaxID=67384 RepID=UPI00343EBE35